MSTVGILLLAGQSTRMGFDKLMVDICGKTAIERSIDALKRGGVDRFVFVVSENTKALAEASAKGMPFTGVYGGSTRTESVYRGLVAAGDECEIAVIHDGARCLVTDEIVRKSIESAKKYGSGVVATKVTDTIVFEHDEKQETLPRDELLAMQTPQTFSYPLIMRAYDEAKNKNIAATDDCALVAAMGERVHFVMGSATNRKLTEPSDIPIFTAIIESKEGAKRMVRVGYGEDVHRLVEGRKLILGGEDIPFEKGLLGHSDADVLAHAITDALLGAVSLGDIGKLFPDTDITYKNADSLLLMKKAKEAMGDVVIQHIDATVVAERPKLAPYRDKMRENIARTLGIDVSAVSIKATTTEGLGSEGRGECIRAVAVATVQK